MRSAQALTDHKYYLEYRGQDRACKHCRNRLLMLITAWHQVEAKTAVLRVTSPSVKLLSATLNSVQSNALTR